MVAALGLSHLLASFLIGVSRADPLTYGLVSAALASVVILGRYLPARRAGEVDPTEALRGD